MKLGLRVSLKCAASQLRKSSDSNLHRKWVLKIMAMPPPILFNLSFLTIAKFGGSATATSGPELSCSQVSVRKRASGCSSIRRSNMSILCLGSHRQFKLRNEKGLVT